MPNVKEEKEPGKKVDPNQGAGDDDEEVAIVTNQDLLDKINGLCDSVGHLDSRISDLEHRDGSQGGRGGSVRGGTTREISRFESSYQDFVDGTLYNKSDIRKESKEVADRFVSVKEQVNKVRLHPEFSLGDTFYPAKEVPKRCMAIIRKSGNFVQTEFKLLKKLTEEGDISEAGAKLLFTAFLANIQFLQSEQTLCYWEHAGATQDQVKVYKTIHQNPHVTREEAESFELATKISVSTKPADSASAGRGASSNSSRSFGRGGGRSGRPWYRDQKQGQGRWSGGTSGGAGYPYQRERDTYDNLVSGSSTGKP